MNNLEHHFDVALAVEYWIEESIIIHNLKYWLIKNIANGTNWYDWYYWTYNSAAAFAKLFPYMSSKKISRILLDLENKWVIKSWNYNKSPYDKTKWYTIIQNGIIDCSFLSNRETESVQPIPYNKQDNKQDTVVSDNPSVSVNINKLDESINPSVNVNKNTSESVTTGNEKIIDANSVADYFLAQLPYRRWNKKLWVTRIQELLSTYNKEELIAMIDFYKKEKKDTIAKKEYWFIKSIDTFFWFERWTKVRFVDWLYDFIQIKPKVQPVVSQELDQFDFRNSDEYKLT